MFVWNKKILNYRNGQFRTRNHSLAVIRVWAKTVPGVHRLLLLFQMVLLCRLLLCIFSPHRRPLPHTHFTNPDDSIKKYILSEHVYNGTSNSVTGVCSPTNKQMANWRQTERFICIYPLRPFCFAFIFYFTPHDTRYTEAAHGSATKRTFNEGLTLDNHQKQEAYPL